MDLKNSNYKVITNEGAKCGFCNKNLKPIGFDYLYVNYDKSMIEYERCNCEKAIQFWKKFDFEQEEKQRQEKYRKIINSIYKDNFIEKLTLIYFCNYVDKDKLKEANKYAFLDINKDYYNKMEDIIKKELKEIEKESIDNQEKYKQAIEKVLSKVEYYNIAKKLKDLKLINGEKE